MKSSVCAALVTMVLVGCRGPSAPATPPTTALPTSSGAVAKPGPDDPKAVAFLKETMDTYSRLPAYSAKCTWTTSGDGSAATNQQRSLIYQRPNKFRIESVQPDLTQISVCDGTTLLEYSTQADLPATTYQAPDSLATATTMLLGHPSFCGTPLYQFFGGSGNYDQLVDSAYGSVSFGVEAVGARGEKTREVKFYGVQAYGHVTVTIGEKSHRIYQISYDSEPAMQALSDPDKVAKVEAATRNAEIDLKSQAAKDKVEVRLKELEAGKNKPHSSLTVESYTISSWLGSDATTFSTRVPDGMQVNDLTATPLGPPKPPIDLGSVAADFTVNGLDGKKVKLSSFRGHPVMLDFWATWCGPCIAALPETNRIAAAGAASGLKVLAISAESRDTVAQFVDSKRYTMPTYLDSDMSADRSMKVTGLPTTVVIDKDGKILAYVVGGGQESTIHSALAKAGVKGL